MSTRAPTAKKAGWQRSWAAVCVGQERGEGVLVVRVALHAWGVGSVLLAPPHLLFVLSLGLLALPSCLCHEPALAPGQQ